jgi:hypothetical protein
MRNTIYGSRDNLKRIRRKDKLDNKEKLRKGSCKRWRRSRHLLEEMRVNEGIRSGKVNIDSILLLRYSKDSLFPRNSMILPSIQKIL